MQEYVIQYVKDFFSGFGNYVAEETKNAIITYQEWRIGQEPKFSIDENGKIYFAPEEREKLFSFIPIAGLEVKGSNVIKGILSKGAGKAVNPNTGRAANKLKPDLNAQGAHSTFKRSPNTGEITNYKTWQPNTKNPSGFDLIKGYDGIGKPHTNSVTKQDLMPHIHDKTVPSGVRVPDLWEIPLKR